MAWSRLASGCICRGWIGSRVISRICDETPGLWTASIRLLPTYSRPLGKTIEPLPAKIYERLCSAVQSPISLLINLPSECTPWKRGRGSLSRPRRLFLPAPSQHRNPDDDKNCRPPFYDDFSDRDPRYAEVIDQKQRSEHNENDTPYAAFHGFSPLIRKRRFRSIRKFLTEIHAPFIIIRVRVNLIFGLIPMIRAAPRALELGFPASNIDGLVKSPSAALRFTFVVAAHL
jgi:hypothetical protein